MKRIREEEKELLLSSAWEVSDSEVEEAIASVPPHFSASTLVDLGNTCQLINSINYLTFGVAGLWTSGLQTPLSGNIVGNGCNMLNANTFTNLVVTGIPVVTSGALRIAVQTSDSDVSGTYTDPTSGLAQFPTSFVSGGILILNSGALGSGLLGGGVSGQNMQSGFSVAAGFQRPHTFCRAMAVAGDFFIGQINANFIGNLKTTGSGFGYTLAPSSGGINV